MRLEGLVAGDGNGAVIVDGCGEVGEGKSSVGFNKNASQDEGNLGGDFLRVFGLKGFGGGAGGEETTVGCGVGLYWFPCFLGVGDE